MKKITKRQIFVWVLALAPLVLIAAAYGRLPDRGTDAVGLRRTGGL